MVSIPAMLPPPPPPDTVEKTKGTLTVAFGRFNPPTTGHEKLLNQVAKSSDEDDYIIVPSRSQDAKKNPLDADSKVYLARNSSCWLLSRKLTCNDKIYLCR